MYGEPIKLQVGSIFMNRTRKYLFPIIKEYGSDFTSKINTLFKVAVGIGDMIVDRCDIHHENHLFILVDTMHNTSQFVSLLDDIRRHSSCEDDYVYGHVSKSRFHMIVIKIPQKYLPTFSNFKQSKFSQMYSKEEIVKLFDYNNLTNKDIISVLIKDHNYKFEFAKVIKSEFDVDDFEINDDCELDLHVLEREEKFNVPIIKSKITIDEED